MGFYEVIGIFSVVCLSAGTLLVGISALYRHISESYYLGLKDRISDAYHEVNLNFKNKDDCLHAEGIKMLLTDLRNGQWANLSDILDREETVRQWRYSTEREVKENN